MPRFFIPLQWRMPRVITALVLLEFPLTIAMLALTSIADKDNYQTKLWQNGADKGFNSAPSEILYSYSNYHPIPTPVVWSPWLVQYNVIIAVLSMFILIVKSVMFVLHAFIPLICVLVSGLEIGIYAHSIKLQSTPDLSDPNAPSPGLPWYLSKGCKYAEPGNYGWCMQAKGLFIVTCLMIALFSLYLIWGLISLWPTRAEIEEREAQREADIELKRVEEYSPDAELARHDIWPDNRQVFMNLPETPNKPQVGAPTPRTAAFTQLNGGEAPTPGPSRRSGASNPSGGLRFREQYGDGGLPQAR